MGLKQPPPTNKQYSGNPLLDRIQDNVRELVTRVKFILSALDTVGLGSRDIELPDRDYTMPIDEAALVHWSFKGTLSANRRVIVPAAASRARSYIRWPENLTTGGFSLVFVTSNGGSTATLAPANTAGLIIKENTLNTLT